MCQEKLDGVSLQNYHVEIDAHSKCLKVVGECGDDLVIIPGIRMSKMAPTASEMDLALELFDAFLTKHAHVFHQFMDAKNAAENIKIPKTADLPNACIKQDYYGKWILEFLSAAPFNDEIGDRNITAGCDGRIAISRAIIQVNDLVEDQVVMVNAKELSEIRKFVNALTEYNRLMDAKKEALELINSCKI